MSTSGPSSSPVPGHATAPRLEAPRGDVAALRKVCPTLVLPGEPEYDGARDAWNRDIVGKPAIIARPANAAEVAGVVKWAVACGATMCIASGRHSIYASRDNSLMVDLSRLTLLEVDPAARTVDCGPGIKLGKFDEACAAHGLATTCGTNMDTGVFGLTLGGGFGFLCRRHGLTIDNVLEAEVVLLDGSVVTVAAADPGPDGLYEDLFWALRGGGGNFGIVTRMKLRLHPRGPVVTTTAVHFRTSMLGLLPGASNVVKRWRDWALASPGEVFPMLMLPAGGPVVTFTPYVGDDVKAGEALLRSPATRFGAAVHRETKVVPYAGPLTAKHGSTLQSMFMDEQAPGKYYDTSIVLGSLGDAAVEALLAHTASAPAKSDSCVTLVMPLGCAVGAVPDEATAFGHRAAQFWCISLGRWVKDKHRAATVSWMRGLKAAMAPYVTGSYNTLAAMEGSDFVPYGKGANAARLAAVKARLDPSNILTQCNNVTPSFEALEKLRGKAVADAARSLGAARSAAASSAKSGSGGAGNSAAAASLAQRTPAPAAIAPAPATPAAALNAPAALTSKVSPASAEVVVHG